MSIYSSRTGNPYADYRETAPMENDGWESTRAQTALATQVMNREDLERNAAQQDIGRAADNHVRELFVSCAPGEALQQQFEHLHPDFVAVHDLGTRSSRQLLRGIAAACSRPVHKLVLRRQGQGTPLASIDYVDVPIAAQQVLRLYSTDVSDTSDAAATHGVARTLLAFSQLGVMMVGSLPAATLNTTLRPWHEEVIRSPWHNRQLLLLPLTNNATLVTQGQEMVRGTAITLRTTPVVTRPADAWNFINGTWNRMHGTVTAPARPAAAPSAPASAPTRAPAMQDTLPMGIDSTAFAPTNMLPLRPMPDVSAKPEPMHDEVLDVYVHQVCELNGVVGCCVFDIGSGLPVASSGSGAPPAELARHGRTLLSAMGSSSRALGLGHTLPDAAITLGSHHLLLRSVDKHSGMALITVLDRTNANLTLARLQIERLDPLLDR
jgi:hypothetical protein